MFAVFIKFFVLFALADVVMSRSGDIGKDVKVEYTYEDSKGEVVKVEHEYDRLQEVRVLDSPSGDNHVQAESLSRVFAFNEDRLHVKDARLVPTPVPVPRGIAESQHVKVGDVPVPRPEAEKRFVRVDSVPEGRTTVDAVRVPVPVPGHKVELQFVQRKDVPETTFVHVGDVPRRTEETRYVQVEAVPVPAGRTTVETVDVPIPIPEVEARYVQVEAVPVDASRFNFDRVHVAPPRREGESRFVHVDSVPFTALTPLLELDTSRYVQVEAVPAVPAPVPQRYVRVDALVPRTETRYVVEVDGQRFQTHKDELPAVVQFVRSIQSATEDESNQPTTSVKTSRPVTMFVTNRYVDVQSTRPVADQTTRLVIAQTSRFNTVEPTRPIAVQVTTHVDAQGTQPVTYSRHSQSSSVRVARPFDGWLSESSG